MASNDLLRVVQIRVDGLFDRYSHDVPLRLEDRVTIIHGPNGVGKTVLLKLTAALLSGKLTDFSKVPFRQFEVSLSDGSTFGVKKTANQKDKNSILGGVFYIKSPIGIEDTFELKADVNEIERLAGRIEGGTPYLMRTGPDHYFDSRTNEVLTGIEVVSKFPEYLPERFRSRGVFDEPEWLQNTKKRVGVHLIEAQRLLRFVAQKENEYGKYYAPYQSHRYVETVKDYATDLQRRISETLTTYAKESQSLDQSFPERLLRGTEWGGLPVDALKSRMQDLDKKRQQLKRIALIDEDAAYPFDVSTLEKVDATQRSVMTLYVDDTAKKLGALDDLSRRVEILLENINKKFRHKTIRISKEKGLTAVTAEGHPLELEALSSGEQHELVLLYDLLFRVRANTLVLIDEPELSLHVTWQKSFLPDLLEIVAATNFDVLLATHSPFVVGDRNDLMVPLTTEGQQAN